MTCCCRASEEEVVLSNHSTAALREVLDAGRFDYVVVQQRVAPPTPTIPTLHLPMPDLRVYDTLLIGVPA